MTTKEEATKLEKEEMYAMLNIVPTNRDTALMINNAVIAFRSKRPNAFEAIVHHKNKRSRDSWNRRVGAFE